ncbi:MAG: hypothetical protein LBC41_10100 [Clostridiales bacterium]|nr:hypothetical protein [Clostridiales bacterium]MDR2751002.1 hypothetical protein [Clostridiales bacterium]
MGEALLVAGLALSGISLAGAIAVIVVGIVANKRLQATLDEEYGKKPR